MENLVTVKRKSYLNVDIESPHTHNLQIFASLNNLK